MEKDVQVIWAKKEEEYFFKWGWTGVSVICPDAANRPTVR
jgi:hypothetical protein